jgi:hypothetical protein
VAKAFQYEPIQVPPSTSSGWTAAQHALIGEIKALQASVVQRRLWSAAAVRELLQGAVNTAVIGNDPSLGRSLFVKAETLFQNDVQTKNRLFYLLGMGAGLAALGVIAMALLAVASWSSGTELASKPMLVSLFAFAAIGSVASVLARLDAIDLKFELRRKWVVTSAAVRPLIAFAFASISYVVINAGVIEFAGFGDVDSRKPLIWIAAFLCGYSERFAADLLKRLPFTRES